MMFFHGVPLDCINQAAIIYHIPATIIVSIIQAENGRNGSATKNTNGSYDLGVMQINTTWANKLKKYGITKDKLQYDSCLNVKVGAWILAQGIADNEGWQGIGNYNSKTPKFNKIYREKVKKDFYNIDNIFSRNV